MACLAGIGVLREVVHSNVLFRRIFRVVSPGALAGLLCRDLRVGGLRTELRQDRGAEGVSNLRKLRLGVEFCLGDPLVKFC